jgi:hypothetical protein
MNRGAGFRLPPFLVFAPKSYGGVASCRPICQSAEHLSVALVALPVSSSIFLKYNHL